MAVSPHHFKEKIIFQKFSFSSLAETWLSTDSLIQNIHEHLLLPKPGQNSLDFSL